MAKKLQVIIALVILFSVLSCSASEGTKLKLGFDLYDFGNIDLRQKDSTQLTIENTSSKIYNVTNFRLSGPNASEFSLIGTGTYMIMPQEIKQITIEFEPTDAGLRTALLEFDSSAQSKPFTVDLQGTGIATPMFEIDHNSHDYGKTYVTFSKTFDFEIANKGTGDLTVSQMNISGANAADFTIISGIAPVTIHSNFTDPTNYTHIFTIEYAPQIAGSSTATLEIIHDATGSPVTINLAGTAEDPFSDLSVTPDPISIQGVMVNNTGDLDVEIESTGILDLNISDISVVAGNSTEFSIFEVVNDGTPVTTAPYACTVPVGKKCVVTIRFAPTTDGFGKTSTLEITSDANTSPTSINIDGGTGYPVLINECEMGGSDYVELYNIGSTPIDISGWNIQCWYLRGTAANKKCGDLTFPNNAVIPANSCIIIYETSGSGDYYINDNIMWISGDGGETILKDKNGKGVDYMFFNMATADHKPTNITWNGASVPDRGEVNHYRNSITNTYSAADWSYRTSSPDKRSKNPGQ